MSEEKIRSEKRPTPYNENPEKALASIDRIMLLLYGKGCRYFTVAPTGGGLVGTMTNMENEEVLRTLQDEAEMFGGLETETKKGSTH